MFASMWIFKLRVIIGILHVVHPKKFILPMWMTEKMVCILNFINTEKFKKLGKSADSYKESEFREDSDETNFL